MKGGKVNPWIKHMAATRKAHPKAGFKEVAKIAKRTYKHKHHKKGGMRGGAEEGAENDMDGISSDPMHSDTIQKAVEHPLVQAALKHAGGDDDAAPSEETNAQPQEPQPQEGGRRRRGRKSRKGRKSHKSRKGRKSRKSRKGRR